ncbi:TonB-dependent receptor plug domain-containing protein [Erythrobacter sp.]|uniref:TonB-dependent receptor plug domain-containing protein n=1 Tax=Erythrobacter sp. TaxID=1042 RepID=UPI0025D1FD3D|nr:TonB-dependent receptor plug domain-containing protein [Erythrobacter sp.]
MATQPLAAQEMADEADDAIGTVPGAASGTARDTFLPADFARFAPRSALDMAQQVPGFSIRSGDGARGLGQADTNVIVNGRRISGKSNGPVEALQRIPVEDVVRLELVDGASLDIGGLSGQVLNVVTLSSGRIAGQFRLAPQFRSKGTPGQFLDGSVAIAGGGAKTDWTLALENDSNRRGDQGIEQVFDGSGALIAIRDEKANFNSDRIGLSGSFTRIADNANVLNLTGQVQGFIYRETELSRQGAPGFAVDRQRTFRNREDEFNFEFGADYQFAFGPGQLKLIGYHRYEDSPFVSLVLTEFTDDSAPQGSVFSRDADQGEAILRSEYNVAAAGGNLVAAVEGVRNFLDITSALEVRDADGVLRPAALPGASSRVDEDRADAGLTYSRALLPSLQLQLSAGGEYSRLSQSGLLGQTRSFWRPKGFVALDWKAGSALNLAGRVERVVGQLDFFDFIASVDLNQERTDVTNADLVPPQSWNYEVEASLRLGALGNVNLRGFYEDITDIVDQIPIAGGGQAPGNLPAAQRFGITGDVTLLSDPIGWRGTRIDVSFGLRDSDVIDPLLGIGRQLSGTDIIDLRANLRHDFPGTAWAMGGNADWEDNSPSVRLDEVSLSTQTFGFASVFVENKDVAGMTMRASAGNLLDRRNQFERTIFTDRKAGQVAFFEQRSRDFGMIFTLEVEGSF